MIRLTERKSDGSTPPVLVDPFDISAVTIMESDPNHSTGVLLKSNPGMIFAVIESVSEVEEMLNAAITIKPSGS